MDSKKVFSDKIEYYVNKEYGAFCRKLCPTAWKDSGNGNGKKVDLYRSFFRDEKCDAKIFKTDSTASLERFIGVALSASYAPVKTDEVFQEFINGLTTLFEKYSKDGQVLFFNHAYSYVGEV